MTSNKLALTRAGSAFLMIALLVGVCTFDAIQYYRWREGLFAGRAYHEDLPLGKFSLGELHFGACLTDVEGGSFASYCDGIPSPPPGEAFAPNPMSSEVWLGPQK